MSLTNAGLTNIGLGAGYTTNFRVQYESTLPGQANIIDNANALLAVLENEFTVTTEWFGTPANKFGTNNRQIVNLNQPDNSGASHNGVNPINMDAQGGNSNAADAAGRVRTIFINEWVEILMDLTNGRWKGGDSSGEGLSQFCGITRYPVGHYSYYPGSFVTTWLNTSPRPNWVDKTEGTDKDQTSYSCALAFLFYLSSELNYTPQQIIAAGITSTTDTLEGLYQVLTGNSNGWTSFINLVNTYYPATSTPYSFVGDDLFPVSKLSTFWAPNQVTCGYSDSTAQIFLDRPAQAEVVVTLTSSDPSVLSVPSPLTLPHGASSAPVRVTAAAIAGPFAPKFVTVTGSYAGGSVQMVAEVVPPKIASLTLSSNSVIAGTNVTATVNLDRPSLLGDVLVDVVSGTGFATVTTPVVIPLNASSATFKVVVPAVLFPFPTAHATINASYSGSFATATLTINPSVVAGILSTLTIFPTTVNGGVGSEGTVTLEAPVPTATQVALSATGGGPLPVGSASNFAVVPASVTVPAGQTVAKFTVTTKPHPNTPGAVTATIVATAVVSKFAMLTIN
jgi:hypothetical protein